MATAGKDDDDGSTKAAMDVDKPVTTGDWGPSSMLDATIAKFAKLGQQAAAAVAGEEEEDQGRCGAASDPVVVSRKKHRRRRLPKRYLKSMLALQRPETFPSSDYLDSLAAFFPPEWIAKQKQEHEEAVALLRRLDEKHKPSWDRFRQELREKGYVEADGETEEDRLRRLEEDHQWLKQRWAESMDLPRIHVATPEDDLLQADGYIDYVTDPEDDLLLSSYPDDDDDDDDDGGGGDEEDAARLLMYFNRTPADQKK